MSRGRCYVGTSGWSYAHWARGRFYPRGMKPGEWLPFYARHFGTVEINTSFYRLPRPEIISRWREVTGSRFRFSVKLWRRITHEKRLTDCGQELRDFFEVIGALVPKRGPLLIQLPPSIKKDVSLLDDFLAALRKTAGRVRWKVAVEFRNPDWLCEQVYEVLDRHGAALCLADTPRCTVIEPNDVSFVYVRRHGPGGSYRGRYSPQQVAADAERTRGWVESGKDVFVYYNNDIEGHAVDNARELMEAIDD